MASTYIELSGITGEITNVTVSSPLVSSGGSTPNISLPVGNLTDVGTDGITVTGGTGAVVGSGTSIAQQVADTTHNGYLSSSDWNSFNVQNLNTNTQLRYVNKAGNDSTGNGSISKPYLTVTAAMGSITDATLTKKYAIIVGAGNYTEPASPSWKPNVSVIGQGALATVITNTSGSTTLLNNDSGGSSETYQGFRMNSALIMTRSVGIAGANNLELVDLNLGASITATGAGNGNQDILYFRGCIGIQTITVNGMILNGNTSTLGGVTMTPTGVDASTTNNISSLRSVAMNILTLTGPSTMTAFVCRMTGLTFQNTTATIAADVISLPPTGVITFNGGATDSQVTRSTRSLNLTYVPTVPADWPDPDPATAQVAFDQLASNRVLRAGDTMTGTLTIDGATDQKKLIVKGGTSQTNNLQDWQNNSSTILSFIGSNGGLNIGSGSNVISGAAAGPNIVMNFNDSADHEVRLINNLADLFIYLSGSEASLGTSSAIPTTIYSNDKAGLSIISTGQTIAGGSGSGIGDFPPLVVKESGNQTDRVFQVTNNTGSTERFGVDINGKGYLSGDLQVNGNILGTTTGNLKKETGDINLTSFSAANNQAVAVDVTGLAFANGTVRAANIILSVFVDATTPLYEAFELLAIQKGSSWEMDATSVGDNALFTFSITASGQVQYTNGNYPGFNAATIKFRAITTSV